MGGTSGVHFPWLQQPFDHVHYMKMLSSSLELAPPRCVLCVCWAGNSQAPSMCGEWWVGHSGAATSKRTMGRRGWAHTPKCCIPFQICEALWSPRAPWMGSTSLPARSWWLRCPHFLGFLSLLKHLSGSQPLIDTRSASGVAEEGFFHWHISLWSPDPAAAGIKGRWRSISSPGSGPGCGRVWAAAWFSTVLGTSKAFRIFPEKLRHSPKLRWHSPGKSARTCWCG